MTVSRWLLPVTAALLTALAPSARGQGKTPPRPEILPEDDAPAAAEASVVRAAENVDPIPARPADGLFDEGGFFRAAEVKHLTEVLGRVSENTGYRLYLTVPTYISNEPVSEYARRTTETWIGEGPGGISIAVEKGLEEIGFSATTDVPGFPLPEDLLMIRNNGILAATSVKTERLAERIIAMVDSVAADLLRWKAEGVVEPATPEIARQKLVPVPDPARAVTPVPEPAPETPAPAPAAALDPAEALLATAAPADFIADGAAVIPDSALAGLRQKLRALHDEHDVDLYFVSVTWTHAGSDGLLAQSLANRWLGQRPGGVVVCDRSATPPVSVAGVTDQETWFTPTTLDEVHTAATRAAAAAGESPDVQSLAALDSLRQAYLEKGLPIREASARTLPPSTLGALPYVGAGVAVLALLLYAFKRWQDRQDREDSASWEFPDVFVSERLGAPRGGGVASEFPVRPPPDA